MTKDEALKLIGRVQLSGGGSVSMIDLYSRIKHLPQSEQEEVARAYLKAWDKQYLDENGKLKVS